MFQDLKMTYKLVGAFIMLSTITLGVGVQGLYGFRSALMGSSRAQRSAAAIEAVLEMKLSVVRSMQLLMEALTAETTAERNDAWRAHDLEAERFKNAVKLIATVRSPERNMPAVARDDDFDAMLQKAGDIHMQKFLPVIDELRGYLSSPANQAADQNRAAALDAQADDTGNMLIALLDEIEGQTRQRGTAVAAAAAKSIRAANTRIVLSILVGFLVSIGFGVFLARRISAPIARAAAFADHLAKGDLTKVLVLERKDEIGQLAQSLNRTASSLARMFRQFENSVATLRSASQGLSCVSEQMSQNAGQTSAKSNAVASAAEQMSAGMSNVAASSEQASTNLAMIATATEELTATIGEIARHSEEARAISTQAVSRAANASEKLAVLGDAAQAIGKVTEVITEISEQTNLLALNATIEAARAGEAGKGFAVVANEIKELARQTAQATTEIKSRIQGIQTSTTQTVKQIGEASGVIAVINDLVGTIASAIEEQSATTREIAGNISQASSGIAEVNSSIAQSSTVADTIAQSIATVNGAAGDISSSATQVNLSARELTHVAEKLSEQMGAFKAPPARFDIGAVKSAHLAWRARLEAVLGGYKAMRPEEVASHHECEFGKWFDGPQGQKLAANPIFRQVGQHHEAVHDLARRIVRLSEERSTAQAEALMKDFEEARARLFEALDRLYLM